MASSAERTGSCSIDDCKRDASALCLHCEKYVCTRHYLEHVKQTNNELLPLSDQLNTLLDNLHQMNVTRLSQYAEEQLEQWHRESHRRIDEVCQQKKKMLNNIVQLKLEEEKFISKQLSDAAREYIDQQDTSHHEIEKFKKTFRALEDRCTTLLQTDFFHVNIEPLQVVPNSLIIKARQHSYFIGGGALLCLEFQFQLNQWIEQPGQRWRLVYKATRDGFEAEDFHRCADNQGPTLTIIQSKDEGWLFGGYTSQQWTSTAGYVEDKNQPFIFTLINPHHIPPTRYVIDSTKTADAIVSGAECGPTFGSGADLHVCNESDAEDGSYFKFPVSYMDSTGKGSLTFTGNHIFLTSEIEVYRLA